MATNKKKIITKKPKTPNQPIERINYPELVFGLIGPAGTDLKSVFSILKRELESVGYRVPRREVRLSDIIQEFLGVDYSKLPEFDRIEKLMTDGTRIREESKNGGAVALLSLLGIDRARRDEFGNSYEQNAYILHSIKHQDEITVLRNIYGRGFYAIAVYAPRESRVTRLAARISSSNHYKQEQSRSLAELLIERDEKEGKKLGQNVKDAFPLADLFIDDSDKNQLEQNIKRFVEALFSYPYHTPTKDEYGMYHAKSAALRSADLARQVGAAISTESGDIISVGCNDIPKAGGGLYWTGDKPDSRDFVIGKDASNEQRQELIVEFMCRLKENGLLSDSSADIPAIVESLLVGERKNVLESTQVLGLIEFGRSVHAEMAALMDASRRGVSVKDATLYTTTFPCHLCAKHIIAAGIKRVVYIEPYPKSRAQKLYSDSIVVDSPKRIHGHVNFEPFVGIAPTQYFNLFEMQGAASRKEDSGKVVDWPRRGTIQLPRVQRFMNTYLIMEKRIIGYYVPKLAKVMGVTI